MLPVLYEFPEDIANDTRRPAGVAGFQQVVDGHAEPRPVGHDQAAGGGLGPGQAQRARARSSAGRPSTSTSRSAWRCVPIAGSAPTTGSGPPTGLTLDALLERSEVVVIGIDGGGLDDLLGLAVLGRDRRPGTGCCGRGRGRIARCWSGARARPRSCATSKPPANCGSSPTWVDDIAEIAALAERIDESGKLGSVGLDPFGVGAIVDALAEVGIAGNDRVVGITQGWKLTGAIKTAERKLADGTLRHGGQR